MGSCYYRLNGVGSYSYTTWTGSDCASGSTKTVTGKFNILVSLDGGSQLRVRITQDTTDALSPGDEFNTWRNLGECDCKLLSESGLTNYDNRCLTWGYWNTAFVRCGHSATATVEAIP